MERQGARKDSPVANTIARIEGILDSLGFPGDRAAVAWWQAGSDCHSCHLRFSNYPVIFSNGKGSTRDLAYASALAEFLERLQCRTDDLFTRAGNIHRFSLFEARRARTLAEIARDAPRLAAGELRELTPDVMDALPCLACSDILGRRVVDLPLDAFRMMTGSTGMCAGNTPEEALVQGLCEVFERHAIRAVGDGYVPGLPTLPFDDLPLKSTLVGRQLDALRSLGADVLVKDASLGGQFPVLALVLVDRRHAACQVSFGSDPDFDIALSRCITESFQGTDHLVRPLPERAAGLRSPDVYNRTEQLLDSLLNDVGTAAVEQAFSDVEDNRAALCFVVERAAHEGRRIYVRDCSRFGFPSYYVYVDGLSALSRLTPRRFSRLYAEWEDVRATIFALGDASRAEIERCAVTLFDELTGGNPFVEHGFARSVLVSPVVAALDLRPLLLLMLLETGRVDEARRVLVWPPLCPPAPERTAALRALASLLPAYARSRGGRATAGELRAAFTRGFGEVEELPAAPAEAANWHLPVPCCHSVYGCPACPCRRFCCLDEWRRLALRLHDRAGVPDQAALIERLAPSLDLGEPRKRRGDCRPL